MGGGGGVPLTLIRLGGVYCRYEIDFFSIGLISAADFIDVFFEVPKSKKNYPSEVTHHFEVLGIACANAAVRCGAMGRAAGA